MIQLQPIREMSQTLRRPSLPAIEEPRTSAPREQHAYQGDSRSHYATSAQVTLPSVAPPERPAIDRRPSWHLGRSSPTSRSPLDQRPPHTSAIPEQPSPQGSLSSTGPRSAPFPYGLHGVGPGPGSPESFRRMNHDRLPSLSQILASEPTQSVRFSGASPPQWSAQPHYQHESPPRRSPPRRLSVFDLRSAARQSPSSASDSLAHRTGHHLSRPHDETLFSRRRSVSIASTSSLRQPRPPNQQSLGPQSWEQALRPATAAATAAPWTQPGNYQGESMNVVSPSEGDAYHPSYETSPTDNSQSDKPTAPSIWTGTHFLPRFVGERDVPGEGACYFYDDGTHCKKVIDGEVVNAHWGVTKAGKPRKRLAVACLTCREKKIKCDPDFPKCVQCDKFGRVCRFRNAPRGTRTTPEPPGPDRLEPRSAQSTHSAQTSTSGDARESFASDADQEGTRLHRLPLKRKNTTEGASVVLDRHTQESDSLSASRQSIGSKRRRTSSLEPVTMSERTHEETEMARSSGYLPHHQPLGDPSRFRIDLNPLLVDAGLTHHFLDLFFDHVDCKMFSIFTNAPVLRWVQDSDLLPQEDISLIYLMISAGMLFFKRSDQLSNSRQLAQRVVDKWRRPLLSTTLARIHLQFLLGLRHSIDDLDQSREYTAAAMVSAMSFRLHLEPTMDENGRHGNYLRAGPEHYLEFRRRTFWAMFINDRIQCICFDRLPYFTNNDIFLRLPCQDDDEDEPRSFPAPFFQELLAMTSRHDLLGAFSYGPLIPLIHVLSISESALTRLRRLRFSTVNDYAERYAQLRNETSSQLSMIKASLPADLRVSDPTEREVNVLKEPGFKFVVHMMLHLTNLRLNLEAISSYLGRQQVAENLRGVSEDARQVLQMVRRLKETLAEHEPMNVSYIGVSIEYILSLALDSLTAKGRADSATVQENMHLLSEGLALLEPMAKVSNQAAVYHGEVNSRLNYFHQIDVKPSREATSQATFSLSNSLVRFPCLAENLLYSVPPQDHIAALERQI